MDILTRSLIEASIKNYIVTEGLKGEKGDKGDKGDSGDVSLSQLNEVKTDLNNLETVFTELEEIEHHVVLSGTYTGTLLTSIDVDVNAGTYIIDVDSIVSSDTDAQICSVTFIYNTSGSTYAYLTRGSNIRKKIILDNDVKQINIYASDNYAHSTGDTFTFTGFKLCRSYQLKDDIELSRDTRDIVKNLIGSISSYEAGERIYTSSRLTYPSNGIIVSGNFSGYDTYEYTIDCPTSFKVTGKTKGTSNYLAIGTDNSGNVLQLLNQGISGTETQYTDYKFTIDTFGVTKVYICLYASESDSVQIGIISSGGVSDYDELGNKPQINGVTVTGNNTSSSLGLADEQEITQIKNLQAPAILSDTYSGTTLSTVSINIPSGTYTLEVDSITSADVDTELSLVTFTWSGGSLSVRLPRGRDIQKKVTFKGNVTTMYLYASDSYAHSVGDAFSFTGLKLITGYPLKDEVDDLSQTVQGLSGMYTTYEAGVRTFTDNTLAYIDANNTIALGNTVGYAVYKYKITEPTSFVVTGSTRGTSNYIAIATDDSEKCVQTIEQGASGTTKSYSNFEFTIDDSEATTVYICLYKQSTDEVLIKLNRDVKELSILFVGNSLTQDGIAYLPYMLTKYYPGFRFRFYMWYNGGYDLSQQYAKFTADTECEAFSIAENSPAWTNTTAKMSDILKTYKFNIVCMQEYFNRKTSYTDENLTDWTNCRDYIVSNYMGGNALEFISLFHSPWLTDEQSVYDLTKTGNALILKKTITDDMIATGIALHMARSTALDSLGDHGHLTPDDVHAQEGLPCLLETYTALLWVLDRYGFPTTIYGLPFKMTAEIQSGISVPGANIGTGVIEGTSAQNLLAQEVAVMAYKVGKKFVADNLAE